MGVLSVLTPEFVPGTFSFSIIFSVLDVDILGNNTIQIIFSKDGERDFLVNSGIITIPPMPNEDEIGLPNEYKGLNMSMDFRNVIFETEGLYNTDVFFNGQLLANNPIIVSEYASTRPSYIQYINLNQEKGFVGLYTNNAIDLMKIENLNKIKKMALFDDDWNGTGGSAFSAGAISLFEATIKMLARQPQIAPTGRNSLLMQYELDDKSLIAFEVSERKTEKVYIPKGDYSLAQMEVFTENIGQQINESVERFYGLR